MENTYTAMKNMQVSILVLMDLSLQPRRLGHRISGYFFVSILVLMDLSLQPLATFLMSLSSLIVSILVLMDLSLQHIAAIRSL